MAAIRRRRFAVVLAALAALNALLLALYFHDRIAWSWVLVLDWPARFLVPRESEEAVGPRAEALFVWLAALPWLALLAAVAALGRRPDAR